MSNKTKPAAGEGGKVSWIWGALFFCLAPAYLEIVLKISQRNTAFFSFGLVRALTASLALGFLFWFIGTLIPQKIISRIIVGILLFAFIALLLIEACCKSYFGTYYGFSFMTNMAGDVAGTFMDTIFEIVWNNLWLFPLAFLPLIVFLIFCRQILPRRGKKAGFKAPLVLLLLFVVFECSSIALCRIGPDTRYLTLDYTANSAIPRVGLSGTLRYELQYTLFGYPQITASDAGTDENETTDSDGTDSDGTDSDGTGSGGTDSGGTASAGLYEKNIMDIDFDSLIASDTDEILLAMDQYFGSQEATEKNEYTGLFEGKNLIFISAESFSYALIDEQRTPALYRLSNSGFVFTDYYQPDWFQSTTGGEFANLTGIIPMWVDGAVSMTAAAGNYMPFSLSSRLSALGYDCTAYHDSGYTYYNRDETMPALGYDYYGIGNGLEIESEDEWPASDLEMMQATIGEKIDAYVNDGTLFHTYYMSVSGHSGYLFSQNAMARKNQTVTDNMTYDEIVRGYIACQQELEYALEYLLEELENAEILDDTVIVLSPDHYPYPLCEGGMDYYSELTGIEDTEADTSRYKNTLILWCGETENNTVTVDTPCTSVDILPTLLNLFGLEYDSRLLSGRDIFAEDTDAGDVSSSMHIALFQDYSGAGYSWITSAGTYEASTGVFTPNDGVSVSDTYVEEVSDIVTKRFTFAKYIVSQDYYGHVFAAD